MVCIYIYSNWVIGDDYGHGSHCNLFGGACTWEARSTSFSPEDGSWFETEGICGANTCYMDGHCGMYEYNYKQYITL